MQQNEMPTPDDRTWSPIYTKGRHGGWYVDNVRYPSGACGCVSNRYPDKKWRIVCDDRGGELGQPGDFAFKSRDAAARAERALVLTMVPPESFGRSIQSRLIDLGWTLEHGTAIASKTFSTAVGPKVAFAYFRQWPEGGAVLTGNYSSEGRNLLSPHSVLLEERCTALQIEAAATSFDETVDRVVGNSYAMRLTKSEGTNEDNPSESSLRSASTSGSMTRAQYNARRTALDRAVRTAKKQLAVDQTLSDKLRTKSSLREAEEAVRQHKLGHYELVTEES